MRKKVLEQEFIRLNADYKALLDETIQLREKVATADEALEKCVLQKKMCVLSMKIRVA